MTANALKNADLGTSTRSIKELFFAEKRTLQLAVQTVHDAISVDNQDELGLFVTLAESSGLTEETFRPTVVEAVKLLQAKGAEWFDIHAHGDTDTAWTPDQATKLYRGEYLLIAAMNEVLLSR
jgi:hypothetical protein